MTKLIVGLCTGYPTDEEIDAWEEIDHDNPSLAIRHECPICGSRNTRWVRQEWNLCFNCRIPFTLDQAMDYKQFIEEDL